MKLHFILIYLLTFQVIQAAEATVSKPTRAQEKSVHDRLIEKVENLEIRIQELESRITDLDSAVRKFTFVLEVDKDGYADASWNEIIVKGQRIQAEYWKRAEAYWGKDYSSPSGEGWLGAEVTPVISIVCIEPEYFFHNTARLPGKFHITCPARWGSMLRFFSDGDRVVVDDVVYGMATHAPIGIYVEPGTTVGDMVMRSFDQGIENVVITAMNGTLPVYLAMDQDRFWLDRVKILQHQGALIGIKHGPPLRPDWYPVHQRIEGNVWLRDARFNDLQMEGPHTDDRPQAAMLLSGANTIISNLNLYGWMQGPYCHSDRGLLINGLTMHSSGGKYCKVEEMVPYTVSQKGSKPGAKITGVSAPNEGWYLPKRSMAPRTQGWHKKGGTTL
jgi:hypothetical protein